MKMILKDLMILIKGEPAQPALTGSKMTEPVKNQKGYEKVQKTGYFGTKSHLKGIFYNRRLRNKGYQAKKKIINNHTPQPFISGVYEQSGRSRTSCPSRHSPRPVGQIPLRKSKKDSSKIFFTFLGIRCLSPSLHIPANLTGAKFTYSNNLVLKPQ